MGWSIFKPKTSFVPVVLILAFFARIGSLEACSVCFAARGASLKAYYETGLLLMLLPLLMLGGFSYWLIRRSRKLAAISGHSRRIHP